MTGRFQLLHRQHLELLLIGLARGRHLVVGITNPDPSARRAVPESEHRHRAGANPFTYFERLGFVTAALRAEGVAADRFSVVPFPLHQPALWEWYVPLGTLQLVRASSAWERAKAESLGGGYRVEVLSPPGEGRLASSDLRRILDAGGPWQEAVPAATVPLVEAALSRRPWRERQRDG